MLPTSTVSSMGQPSTGRRSAPRSRTGAEWVRAPTARKSTPVGRVRPRHVQAQAPGGLQLAATGDERHSLGGLGGREVVEQDQVRAGVRPPRPAAPGSRPPPRPGPRGTGCGPPRTPAATPPAATTWLSLTRAASHRPIRWLTPPPQRTAYFSSARRPGRGLAGVADAGTRAGQGIGPGGGGGGHAGQVAQQVQRRALADQQGAGPARDGEHDVPALRPGRRRRGRSSPRCAPSDSISNTRAATGIPATTPAARAVRSRVATWSSGTVATEVTSTPPPRSSARVARIRASIASGSRPAAASASQGSHRWPPQVPGVR